MLNIVIIEDDPHYRSDLEATIHFQPDWLCVYSAGSAEQFKQQLPNRARIDLAFVDIDLPGESGVELIPFIVRQSPEAEIVMLTNIEDGQTLLRAFHKGATGYLLKDFSMFQLPQFVRTLQDGGALISPIMARHLVNYFQPPSKQQGEVEALTPKEEQVLRLISEGNTYGEAAAILDMTIDGIRFYIKKIYKKLGVKKRAEALRLWKESN